MAAHSVSLAGQLFYVPILFQSIHCSLFCSCEAYAPGITSAKVAYPSNSINQ